MGILADIKAWLVGEEEIVVEEAKVAIAWIRPKILAWTKNLEAIFAENAAEFLKQATPVIEQAAAAAIDSGLRGTDIAAFAKDALLPIALALAKNAAHQAMDSTLNTTIELNHAPEAA